MISLLFANPALFAAWIAAVLLSLTFHEFSHAFVARLRGDRTAEREGRLSLNPLDHVDPVGLLAFLFLGFGWAKPVPYNPYNLKDPKWDGVAIAFAGPISNLLFAGVAAVVFRALVGGGVIDPLNLLSGFLFLTVYLNLALAVFNLIPVHPLDGAKLAFALLDGPRHAAAREFIAIRGPQILMFLIVLSFLTPFHPFGFVSDAAMSICSSFLGGSCDAYFGALFAGV